MSNSSWKDYISWFILACFGFVSSLTRYQSLEFNLIAPNLAFPLEQLRANGRPLSIALLVLLTLIALNTPKLGRRLKIPDALLYLCIVQVVILLKTLEAGSLFAGLIIFAVFATVVFMHLRGPYCWIRNEASLRRGLWAIAMVGAIFAVANLYQWTINSAALTFTQGWFHGTTANSQHAGVLMALAVPSIITLLATGKKSIGQKIFWLIILLILIFFLYKTASRTSFVMLLSSLIILFRYNFKQSLTITLVCLLIVFTAFNVLEPSIFQDYLGISADDNTINKIERFDNTRADVWTSQWSQFNQNLLFGSPLRGVRIRFGENSWLGAASGLGLMGFIPMLLFGYQSIKLAFRLQRLSWYYRNTDLGFYCNCISASIVALLIGGFGEAFLLANLNFSLYAVLQFLFMGQFLVSCYPISPTSPPSRFYRLQKS